MMFHVHGGLVISRIVGEIGIAKKVPRRSGKPSEGAVMPAVGAAGQVRPWSLAGPAACLVGLDDRLQVDAVDNRADIQRAIPFAVLRVIGAEEMVTC
jgi:hypothetical protein